MAEKHKIKVVTFTPSFTDRLYFIEIIKGLMVTLKHFLKNLIFQNNWVTIQVPDEKRNYSRNFRGVHLINTRPDGTPKCVACMMCETICPAYAISITAEESSDPSIEKRPARFDIDMLRCIYCGYCVDACPVEAIVMTNEFEFSQADKSKLIYHLDDLMNRPSLKSAGKGYHPV
jgi:NADH-quinone oxidoreductase subunit I